MYLTFVTTRYHSLYTQTTFRYVHAGDTMILIAYNRVDASMISGVLLFWFLSMWFFGNLMRYYTFAKVGTVYCI